MRKLFLFIIMCFSSFLVSCSENQQLYVKNIMFSSMETGYKMTVEYYDFDSEQESYSITEYISDDIYQLGTVAVKEGNYNFRLTENCFISAEIFPQEIDKIIYVINSLRIPVATNMICYSDAELPDDFQDSRLIFTPLYNMYFDQNKTTAGFQITNIQGDNQGAVLVYKGECVKVLTEKQWTVLNMLYNNSKEINYLFRNNEMLAVIADTSSYYDIKDDTLEISITAVLKEYKGIQNSDNSKQIFIQLLKSDIENTVYELYNDTAVDMVYNLHWLCDSRNTQCQDIKITVNII